MSSDCLYAYCMPERNGDLFLAVPCLLHPTNPPPSSGQFCRLFWHALDHFSWRTSAGATGLQPATSCVAGFLPGFNFPRLPLRAILPTGDEPHVVDHPRFLGLSEFGPRNILYHEGRKYRMIRCVLPSGAVEDRLRKAKFCNVCGFFHDDERSSKDTCEHCRTSLNAVTSEFNRLLFEMPVVRIGDGNYLE